MKTGEQNKSGSGEWILMASAFVALALGLICTSSPFYYALYTPLNNVPANAPPIAFFTGKSPTRMGDCLFVEFKLAEPALRGTYEAFSNLDGFIRFFPLFMAIMAFPGIAARRRISPFKFLVAALFAAALLLGTLVFFTPKMDCVLTPSISVTAFGLYWPTIALWATDCALGFFTLNGVYKILSKPSLQPNPTG